MKVHSFRPLLLSLSVGFISLELSAQRIVCDETCKLADAPPAAATTTSAKPVQTKTATAAKNPAVAAPAPVKKGDIRDDAFFGTIDEINESANVAIGRFMNLALMNLCGYYVKQDRMGTFGYPMSWCPAAGMPPSISNFPAIGIP